MSFLLELVRTLKKEEVQKLLLMPVKGREEEVLQKTLSYRTTTDEVDSKIQEELGLSKSHFDKINSVLLEKCFGYLTDGSDAKVFTLLLQKQLLDLLYHEIKMREKAQLKTGKEKEIREFYLQAFLATRKIGVNKLDLALVSKYATEYLKHFPKAGLEDKAEIWLMYEHSALFYNSVMGNSVSYEPQFWKVIHKWEKELKGKNLHRANFHLQLAKANFYDFCSSDGDNLINSLETALQEFEAAKGGVPQALKMYAFTKLAKAYCQTDQFEKALETYKESFAIWPDLKRNVYHPVMFAVIAIINHRFTEAEQMLNENTREVLTHRTDMGMFFNIARNYAVLHIHKNEFDKALEYIHMFLQVNRVETDLLGEILNRIVQNAYFAAIGDWETALSLVKKNKKFLANKPSSSMITEYEKFFNLLRSIIKHRANGDKLPVDFEEQMAAYQRNIAKLYGDLLLKVLKKPPYS
ncbi:MAG: hypothetical protein U0V74_02585 [Chitinophagales bacterium]